MPWKRRCRLSGDSPGKSASTRMRRLARRTKPERAPVPQDHVVDVRVRAHGPASCRADSPADVRSSPHSHSARPLMRLAGPRLTIRRTSWCSRRPSTDHRRAPCRRGVHRPCSASRRPRPSGGSRSRAERDRGGRAAVAPAPVPRQLRAPLRAAALGRRGARARRRACRSSPRRSSWSSSSTRSSRSCRSTAPSRRSPRCAEMLPLASGSGVTASRSRSPSEEVVPGDVLLLAPGRPCRRRRRPRLEPASCGSTNRR